MSQHAQIPPIESICRPTYNTHFNCSLLYLVTVIWRQSYVFDLTSNQRWAVGWLEESTASVGCCQLLKLGLAPHCLNREAQRTGLGNNTQDWREEGAKAGETYCMPIQVPFLQQCWTLLAVDVLNPSQQWPTELHIHPKMKHLHFKKQKLKKKKDRWIAWASVCDAKWKTACS